MDPQIPTSMVLLRSIHSILSESFLITYFTADLTDLYRTFTGNFFWIELVKVLGH